MVPRPETRVVDEIRSQHQGSLGGPGGSSGVLGAPTSSVRLRGAPGSFRELQGAAGGSRNVRRGAVAAGFVQKRVEFGSRYVRGYI